MSTRVLTKTLTYGGIINLVGSPLSAVFLRWWDDDHGRFGDGFPVWIYSFFYCTCILGLMYIQAGRDPERYRSFIGVAVVAKVWGVLACTYAIADEYYWMLPLGIYDVVFGTAYYVLYRRLGASFAASAQVAR
ncbi:hypothetical protein ACWD4O_43935 [Streptomyces sp. NPDC002623]